MKKPEIVTCQNCGKDVPSNDACGVGHTYHMVWTCTECIKQGAMDQVFAPIGEMIRKSVKAASKPQG